MLLVLLLQILTSEYISARCSPDQYLGVWSLITTRDRYTKSNDHVACEKVIPSASRRTVLNVTIMDHGVAQSRGGYMGKWTPISNRGFELRIGTYVFYVVSACTAKPYNDTHIQVESRCNETHFGWRTTQGIQPSSFYCLYAVLTEPKTPSMVTTHYVGRDGAPSDGSYIPHGPPDGLRVPATEGLERDNHLLAKQLLLKTDGEHKVSIDGANGWNLYLGDGLPGGWSWLDAGGEAYLPAWTPPPAGPACNRSYVDAALAAMMARVMVASNRTDPLGRDVFLSAQHVLDCNQYGQGCAGGTPFEVGKFSEDFGVLVTDYYLADSQGNCMANQARKPEVRYYFSNYRYLGSYRGNTNAAEDIAWEIYRNGPVVASVYANADWDRCVENTNEDIRYKATESDQTEPRDYADATLNRSLRHFYASNTNHAVTIVGWGTDEHDGDYWLVLDLARSPNNTCKSPLRRISRGVNAYNIESEVVAMQWVQFPDFLQPDECFVMVPYSVVLTLEILFLVFVIIGIACMGIYISLHVRIERNTLSNTLFPAYAGNLNSKDENRNSSDPLFAEKSVS